MPQRWWIVDAEGHRTWENSQPKPDTMTWMGHEVKVQHLTSIAPDYWVCDWCNDPIEISMEIDGRTVKKMVPMHGTSALCAKCAYAALEKEGVEIPEDDPFGLSMLHAWGYKVCSCPACKAEIEWATKPLSEEEGEEET